MLRVKVFFSSFCVGMILIIGIIGFNTVRISSENYSSGMIGSLASVHNNDEYMGLYLFGEGITIYKEDVRENLKFLSEFETRYSPAPLRFFSEIGEFIKLLPEWIEGIGEDSFTPMYV